MARDVADTLEDLEWLDSTGVGATDAAARSGFASAEAMEKWLDRHDHYPLWLRLKHRDPVGIHDPDSRKKRRAMTETTTSIDTIAALISRAQQSSRKRTRTKADKVSDLVADLRKILDLEAHEDEARETARKDIERLERELREARSRMKGGASVTSISDGAPAAEVRAWAQREGVACPAMGRIPEAVREAYDAANEAAAS